MGRASTSSHSGGQLTTRWKFSIEKAVQVNSLITYEDLWSGGDMDFWTGLRTVSAIGN